jgi:hypothetical protein
MVMCSLLLTTVIACLCSSLMSTGKHKATHLLVLIKDQPFKGQQFKDEQF